ncbi:hypothetical protein [Kribbella sp. CCNWLY201]|uniref:hypothetical protein n=1 Tax=Kribbella sp. CCNWLY201 TaxID=3128544 RepID=UPI003019226E
MHRPDVIVLDDPMTDLDEHGRRELAVVLREVAATGAAVLVTAHGIDDVDAYATRIATFSDRPETAATETAVPTPEATETAVLAPEATETAVLAPEATETAVLAPEATETAVLAPDATETAVLAPEATEITVPEPGAIEAAVPEIAGPVVAGRHEPQHLAGVSPQPSAMERWLDLGSPLEAWQPTRRRVRRQAVRRLRTSSRSP